MRSKARCVQAAAHAPRATSHAMLAALPRWHPDALAYAARALADPAPGFAAAAHHRNWSHRGGLDNNLVMFGLSVRR